MRDTYSFRRPVQLLTIWYSKLQYGSLAVNKVKASAHGFECKHIAISSSLLQKLHRWVYKFCLSISVTSCQSDNQDVKPACILPCYFSGNDHFTLSFSIITFLEHVIVVVIMVVQASKCHRSFVLPICMHPENKINFMSYILFICFQKYWHLID